MDPRGTAIERPPREGRSAVQSVQARAEGTDAVAPPTGRPSTRAPPWRPDAADEHHAVGVSSSRVPSSRVSSCRRRRSPCGCDPPVRRDDGLAGGDRDPGGLEAEVDDRDGRLGGAGRQGPEGEQRDHRQERGANPGAARGRQRRRSSSGWVGVGALIRTSHLGRPGQHKGIRGGGCQRRPSRSSAAADEGRQGGYRCVICTGCVRD